MFIYRNVNRISLLNKYRLDPNESVVRLFFDILHGIDRADIPLVVALEFAILLGYDGQLKQNSVLEKELFESSTDQFKRTELTKVENAMMWLYLKTWGLQGNHVIERNELWNFGGEDLEDAIIGIAYPRMKKSENEDEGRLSQSQDDLVESLRKLIIEKFDGKKDEFYKWSQSIHDEVGAVLVITYLLI